MQSSGGDSTRARLASYWRPEMTDPVYEITTYVPECEGLDMVDESDPSNKVAAETGAWVKYDDVIDLMLKIRAEYEVNPPKKTRRR